MHLLQNPGAYSCSTNIKNTLALDSILADCQHGFRGQWSCETQFVHDIISILDQGWMAKPGAVLTARSILQKWSLLVDWKIEWSIEFLLVIENVDVFLVFTFELVEFI